MSGFARLWYERLKGVDWEGASPVQRLELLVNREAALIYQRLTRRIEIPVGATNELAKIEYARAMSLPVLPAWGLEDAVFGTDFDRAVRELPEPERDSFILTDLRGLDVREAAEVLDVHYSTVSRRANKARSSIRKELS